MPKPVTKEAIEKDLSYVLNGTAVHEALAYIFPPRAGLRVLEPGCGSGKFGLSYWLSGCAVTMTDIDPEVRAYAEALKQRLLKQWEPGPGWPRIEITDWSILSLAEKVQEPYDFVYNEGVPHQWPQNMPERQIAIDQMAVVTRPGGTVAIIGSNAICPEMMEFAARVDHTYMGMPKKQEPFDPEELLRRMRSAGLQGVQVAPVGNDWKSSRLLVGWGRKLA